jgi:putative spermidine/putrescine transport system permease protein
MAGTVAQTLSGAPAQTKRIDLRANRTILLVIPAAVIFILFFVAPVVLLLAFAFNPSEVGVISLSWNDFTLETFGRFFEKPLYWGALLRSIGLSLLAAAIALLLGYPLAYLVAKEPRPGRANLYMILILAAMQLDLIIRMYGFMILMGDLILSLIGVIQGINPSLEEAARSLGAGTWRTFFTITFPMSMPGVLAGSLLVFAIAIGSYAVPVLMGGWRVLVMPMHIYQQVSEVGNWRFGAAIACILFAVSLTVVFVYHRYTEKYLGGLV